MKALVLLPCCGRKSTEGPPSDPRPCFEPDLQEMRDDLRRATGELWATGAPRWPARQLYAGNLYRPLRESWPIHQVDVLIMSAAFGLVAPDEPLPDYDLQMAEVLPSGRSVASFWAARLPGILDAYVKDRGIRLIWSLLPNSGSRSYHSVLSGFWARRECDGHRVSVHRDVDGRTLGSAIGGKRGEWLAATLKDEPKALVGQAPPPRELARVPGYFFRYPPCG